MKSGQFDAETNKEQLSWFKRHKILSVLLILFLIGFIVRLGGSDNTANQSPITNSNETSQNSPPPAATELVKIGAPVRDGKFEFTVKSVECGKPTVGGEYTLQTAKGQYCILSVAVKNIGNEAQSLSGDAQKLFNAAGQEYSYDSTATIYAAPSTSTSWYDEINPGLTAEGFFVFDIPKDQIPTVAELHDSSFSGGVKVSLQ